MAVWPQDEALSAAEMWMVEISALQETYSLSLVIKDIAGENKSKEISEYFVSMLAKNYFNMAYKQHQDGLADSGIKLTLILARSGVAQSELAGEYWFPAANWRGIAEMRPTRKSQEYSLGYCVREKKRRIKLPALRMPRVDALGQGAARERENGTESS